MASISLLSNSSSPPAVDAVMPVNRFADWRRSGIPVFSFKPLAVDLSRVTNEAHGVVKGRCIERYKASCATFDQAIADAALAYVHKDGDPKTKKPGPLLDLARTFSSRLYRLYSLYCRYEMEQELPMIPVGAGQLKNHGFVTSEILRMQEGCGAFMEILIEVKKTLQNNQYEEFFKKLTSPVGRKRITESHSDSPALLEAVKRYEEIR